MLFFGTLLNVLFPFTALLFLLRTLLIRGRGRFTVRDFESLLEIEDRRTEAFSDFPLAFDIEAATSAHLDRQSCAPLSVRHERTH